jgi:hypothetical protein
VHAGENVRLHSAGHKQTGSFFFWVHPDVLTVPLLNNTISVLHIKLMFVTVTN